MFTVRSAYKLEMCLKQQETTAGSSSNASTGRENLWNLIWKAQVPHKIRIVVWRIASDSLPTKENKRRITLEVDGICNIVEDAQHAVLNCTKATALPEEMREHWALPNEISLVTRDPDWLLHALSLCSGDMREKLLLVSWRSWHLRDDIVHDKGKAKVPDSVLFPKSYWETLNSNSPSESDVKGKKPLYNIQMQSPTAQECAGGIGLCCSRRGCECKRKKQHKVVGYV